MNNKIYVIAFLFSILSCNNAKDNTSKFPVKVATIENDNIIVKKDEDAVKITIDISDVIKGDFNNYFEFKDIIYLDNKSPIGQISLIRESGNKIFVLDRNNAQRLFCFDIKGNLLWEFNSLGGGPYEYRKIADFLINKGNNTIDVLDEKGYKIIQLDINTGIAKSSFPMGVYGKEIIKYDENRYLVFTQNITVNEDLNYKLLLIDSASRVHSKNLLVKTYERDKHRTGFRSLERYGNIIYFTETLNDTIYTIENDTLKTAYYVDFLEKKYPEEMKRNINKNEVHNLKRDKGYITEIDLIREKGDFINFTFSHDSKFYIVFYNRVNGKTFLFDKLSNGHLPGEYEQILTQSYMDKGFVRILDSFFLSQVKELINKDENFRNQIIKENPKLYEVVQKRDKNSNPVLFLYEFKKI